MNKNHEFFVCIESQNLPEIVFQVIKNPQITNNYDEEIFNWSILLKSDTENNYKFEDIYYSAYLILKSECSEMFMLNTIVIDLSDCEELEGFEFLELPQKYKIVLKPDFIFTETMENQLVKYYEKFKVRERINTLLYGIIQNQYPLHPITNLKAPKYNLYEDETFPNKVIIKLLEKDVGIKRMSQMLNQNNEYWYPIYSPDLFKYLEYHNEFNQLIESDVYLKFIRVLRGIKNETNLIEITPQVYNDSVKYILYAMYMTNVIKSVCEFEVGLRLLTDPRDISYSIHVNWINEHLNKKFTIFELYK